MPTDMAALDINNSVCIQPGYLAKPNMAQPIGMFRLNFLATCWLDIMPNPWLQVKKSINNTNPIMTIKGFDFL